jgi:hypothetical protein
VKTVQSICIALLKSPTELDESKVGVLSQPDRDWEQHGHILVNEYVTMSFATLPRSLLVTLRYLFVRTIA